MTTRFKWTAVLVLVVAALATAIYFARWRDATPPGGAAGARGGAGQPVPVRAMAVRVGSIDVVLDALGTVIAHNTAVVHARVDGLLQRIAFEEGHDVKAGALLAEIDPRPFAAALEQAQGQLARDEALLISAHNDLDRYQTLLAQDSIAKQQVDDQAALVRQYAGTVQTDRGAVENAHLQLEWTHITAPISGRVGLKQVDLGNMVHAADANGVVVLTQTQPINVVFAVPADSAPAVLRRWKEGAQLPVDAYGRDGKTLLAHGRLESADNVVDPATSTVKLKAVYENTDGALFPNQFVNARLTLATLDNQMLVPSAAVQRGTPGTFAYVVNADSTVSVRPIVLGTIHADVVAVTAGLKPGERVVVDGTDKLRDNAKVAAAVEAPANAVPGQRGRGAGSGRKGQEPGPGAAPGSTQAVVPAQQPASGQRRRPDAGSAGQ